MNTVPHTLATHVDALSNTSAAALADGRLADAAQDRLLSALPRQAPSRGWPRLLAAAASFCAVAVIGVALFLGDARPAFATVQQHLRDFATLRLTIEQRIAGETLPSSTVLLDRDGRVRTDVGTQVSVIVDVPARRLLTLLHEPRVALQQPLPAGAAPARDEALQRLEEIRSFQGEAQPLPPRADGLQGWRLQRDATQIDLWADADGLPRAMQVGGAQGLQLDYRFELDVPIDPVLLSAEVPPGYTLQAADDD